MTLHCTGPRRYLTPNLVAIGAKLWICIACRQTHTHTDRQTQRLTERSRDEHYEKEIKKKITVISIKLKKTFDNFFVQAYKKKS